VSTSENGSLLDGCRDGHNRTLTLQTRTLFEKCLGQSFVIAAVESFEGVPFPLARIDVGHVVGKEPWEHTIWVEQEYLELKNR
jgi:hypothetical protein